jgi:hypothetical protein
LSAELLDDPAGDHKGKGAEGEKGGELVDGQTGDLPLAMVVDERGSGERNQNEAKEAVHLKMDRGLRPRDIPGM